MENKDDIEWLENNVKSGIIKEIMKERKIREEKKIKEKKERRNKIINDLINED